MEKSKVVIVHGLRTSCLPGMFVSSRIGTPNSRGALDRDTRRWLRRWLQLSGGGGLRRSHIAPDSKPPPCTVKINFTKYLRSFDLLDFELQPLFLPPSIDSYLESNRRAFSH